MRTSLLCGIVLAGLALVACDKAPTAPGRASVECALDRSGEVPRQNCTIHLDEPPK